MAHAAIQGRKSSQSSGFAQEPMEIPPLSFLLGSLAVKKNAAEVKSLTSSTTRELLLAQISTHTALHSQTKIAYLQSTPKMDRKNSNLHKLETEPRSHLVLPRGCCREGEAAKKDGIPKEPQNLVDAGTRIEVEGGVGGGGRGGSVRSSSNAVALKAKGGGNRKNSEESSQQRNKKARRTSLSCLSLVSFPSFSCLHLHGSM